jgi:hypothetical protein
MGYNQYTEKGKSLEKNTISDNNLIVKTFTDFRWAKVNRLALTLTIYFLFSLVTKLSHGLLLSSEVRPNQVSRATYV